MEAAGLFDKTEIYPNLVNRKYCIPLRLRPPEIQSKAYLRSMTVKKSQSDKPFALAVVCNLLSAMQNADNGQAVIFVSTNCTCIHETLFAHLRP
jgi:hypothetical protein